MSYKEVHSFSAHNIIGCYFMCCSCQCYRVVCIPRNELSVIACCSEESMYIVFSDGSYVLFDCDDSTV